MTSRKHGLMRMFWPSDAPKDNLPGVVVGWRNSELDILVVAVLQGVEVRNVEYAIRMRSLFKGSPHPVENIFSRCGGQPIQVVGTLNASTPTSHLDRTLLSLHHVPGQSIPQLQRAHDVPLTMQIVVFDKPDPVKMQYLSITPISLALGDKRGVFGSVPPFDRIDKDEDAERRRKEKLVEKLRMHTIVQHPRTPKELALPVIIAQINCSTELDGLIQQNIGMIGVKIRRSLSVSERVVESATNLWDLALLQAKQSFKQNIWPMASKFFVLYLLTLRIVAEMILLVLEWRPFGHAALKDVSATAQQVDIRLQQFCYWPAQYLTLHSRRNDWESITNSHPEYIRFFNSLWLVANDIIIGIALGSYIVENVDLVASEVDKMVDLYAIEGLQHLLSWLMDYPGGLKLNNELATFLGDLFLWVIDYWSGCMSQLRPYLPTIIRLIGFSSFAGASLPISMFSDLLSLSTIHIYSFYIASARIYNWQLTIITSLFHLFRGKKRNVLRNRIDSCDYDLDQLLLGTILFTLLFFLLPTVAVFYATFAGARMAIIALKAALDTWLACLNHFPLFAIMLRVKDSRRLPGGIRFELQDPPRALSSEHSHHDSAAPSAHIKLKSIPLPLTQTFSQYAQLGQRLRKHYLSPRVFLGLVSGQFVPPIHRKNLYSLQYSMLPVQRVGIGDLWKLLTEDKGHDVVTSNANGYAGSNNAVGKRSKGRNVPDGYWWSK